MHQTNYEILSFVSESGPCSREAIWQRFGMGNYKKTDSIIDQLVCKTLLDVVHKRDHYLEVISISSPGLDALANEKQRREDRAAEEAEKAKNEVQRIADRKQDRRDKWLISIVSACCGSVLTLCIEHFSEIAIFFGKLLRMLFEQ